jgi:DNA-binding transcriptional LysR family regulator
VNAAAGHTDQGDLDTYVDASGQNERGRRCFRTSIAPGGSPGQPLGRCEVLPMLERRAAALENLLEETRPFDPESDGRAFRISASDYSALLLFGPIVRRLIEAAPHMSAYFLRLDVTAGERLNVGEIDFAIFPAEIDPALPSIPLFDDTWVCAACSRHPSLGDELTIEEFLKHPHMSFNISDPGHVSVADEFLERNGHERRIVASTESFTAAPFLLQGTTLLTILPRRLGERMQQAAQIRLLELPFDVPPLREKLVWNPRFTSSPGHAWMREQFVEVAGAL